MQLEHFDPSAFVHHSVSTATLVEKSEGLDSELRNLRCATRAGDLVGFAAGQRQDAVGGAELSEGQGPTHSKATVLAVDRIEFKCQWQVRATQVIGVKGGQVDGHGVLAGARVNGTVDEAMGVKGVGCDCVIC